MSLLTAFDEAERELSAEQVDGLQRQLERGLASRDWW